MISTFLIFSLVFYIHLGQVPPHVPPAQNQTLGNQMAEMQGLVQASLNAPVNPVEEPQVPEEPVEELNMESAYVVEQQDMEAEREVPVESGIFILPLI